MEFRLVYSGPLHAASASQRRVEEKHQIRTKLHEQLKQLWDLEPLVGNKELLREQPSGPSELALYSRVGKFLFAPVISSHLSLHAELDIVFLRPGPPGEFLSQGGDLDNRLKTLIDALRIPVQPEEIPVSFSWSSSDDPIFCLLDDDRIITKLTVSTDRLLKPVDKHHVELLIHARSRAWRHTWVNDGLG